METHIPVVVNHGFFAQHDMACAVYGCERPAVLDLDDGIFQPCWEHQREGYQLLKPNERRWRKRGALRGAA